jgi:hypothetical protein
VEVLTLNWKILEDTVKDLEEVMRSEQVDTIKFR